MVRFNNFLQSFCNPTSIVLYKRKQHQYCAAFHATWSRFNSDDYREKEISTEGRWKEIKRLTYYSNQLVLANNVSRFIPRLEDNVN